METPFSETLVALGLILPQKRILTDALSLSVYARDASLYRIEPKVVIKVENEDEMAKVMALAHQHACPVGYRAAGTSLSGQALTSGILILQGEGWRELEVLDRGGLVRVGPGLRGSEVNAKLKPYQRKIGPDPASIDAAKIGGIAANNASGMCCGTQFNTYQTMESLKIVFSDGSLLDTGSEYSRQNFRRQHSKMLKGIELLAEDLRCHPDWVEMVLHKYLIKNTTGYAINSFLDYSDPIDIIAHLMIGSEGTLGYISEITYKTVPEYEHKSNALVFFSDIESACWAVQALKDLDVNAIELMDTKALKSVPDQVPAEKINAETTALLIEVQAEDAEVLSSLKARVQEALSTFSVEVIFTKDPVTYAKHWKIRKGMFPSVAAMRAKEETVIIEDIAIPLDSLSQATLAIQKLFVESGYPDAIIFGHAQAGNLHIVFTQAFGTQEQTEKYQHLMDRLSELVVDQFGGSLKAEHGTGRNMAPFVKKEWGDDLYQLMKNIKSILDPKNILNPGVLISEDKSIHLKNLKPMPSVHDGIDGCMECGFCERVCPSKDLSLTPRGRISAMREMKSQGKSLHSFVKGELEREMQYQGVETCAADGMCAEACPVKINTGKFVKHLRELQHSAWKKYIASASAKHQVWVERLARMGLKTYHGMSKMFGQQKCHRMLDTLNVLSFRLLPRLQGPLPRDVDGRALGKALQDNASIASGQCIVLYQSCINRVFGESPLQDGIKDVTSSIVSLATKSGIRVIMASGSGQCCGLPYASKGFGSVAMSKLQVSLTDLEKLSESGRWTVVVDNSPCSQELLAAKGHLNIVDAVEWLDQSVLNLLTIHASKQTLALHTTCSAKKMGLQGATQRISQALSSAVIEPEGIECCGFAGDRGFSHPELNRSALSSLSKSLGDSCVSGVSSSKTCALGLEWNSGRPYPHIAQLLDSASQGKDL